MHVTVFPQSWQEFFSLPQVCNFAFLKQPLQWSSSQRHQVESTNSLWSESHLSLWFSSVCFCLPYIQVITVEVILFKYSRRLVKCKIGYQNKLTWFVCMYFLLVPLWWQIWAHRNKGQGQRAKNRGGRWKKDWEAHRRPSNMEEQQIKARRSSTYVGKARRSMKGWPQRMAAPTTVDNSITQPLNTKKVQRYPNGCAATDVVQCQCNTWDCQSKLVAASPSEK